MAILRGPSGYQPNSAGEATAAYKLFGTLFHPTTKTIA